MVTLAVKKTITKNRRTKNEVDGEVCSVHSKKRKSEYLIDDGAGGMCCPPGDECKGVKQTPVGRPERKRQGRGQEDGDRNVCSIHDKQRKAEYLIDDGAGGMCCPPGDECKGVKETPVGKPERKRRGKDVDPDECKWCELGECWTHGQIEKPERKGHRQKEDVAVARDVCSVHGKQRKAEYLIDDGEGGMCCPPGDECKGVKEVPVSIPDAGDVCSVHGKKRKAEYLIDDGVGGMCCPPGDECKGVKEIPVGKPERKRQGRGQADVVRDVCSMHGKQRKAEYLIDDGSGGMCCPPGDECKGSTDIPVGKSERKRQGRGQEDGDRDVCSIHGKQRKAEYLIDDGAGGMCCPDGDKCKGLKETLVGKPERNRRGKDVDPDDCTWCELGECWTHGQIEKPERAGGKQMTHSRGRGNTKTPTPAMVRAAIQNKKTGSRKGGKGKR